MQARIYRMIVVALLALAPAARAATVPIPANESLLQEHTLTATNNVQVWESRRFPAVNPIHIRIYVAGIEAVQRWGNPCAANYVARGVLLGVRIIDCQDPRHSTFRLRYVSVAHPRRVLVRITT